MFFVYPIVVICEEMSSFRFMSFSLFWNETHLLTGEVKGIFEAIKPERSYRLRGWADFPLLQFLSLSFSFPTAFILPETLNSRHIHMAPTSNDDRRQLGGRWQVEGRNGEEVRERRNEEEVAEKEKKENI